MYIYVFKFHVIYLDNYVIDLYNSTEINNEIVRR